MIKSELKLILNSYHMQYAHGARVPTYLLLLDILFFDRHFSCNRASVCTALFLPDGSSAKCSKEGTVADTPG